LSLAVDPTGRYMATGGADSQVKIWDLRMYRETHAYFTTGAPPSSLDISQQGLLGIGHGTTCTVWKAEALSKKVSAPYMRHDMPGCGPVETVRFRPFEDVCGVGHQKGISSIVIPGSGEANLDTMEYNTNPFQDKKQRREAEVRSLLDKLSPNMIHIDPNGVVGTVEDSNPHLHLERVRDIQDQANAKRDAAPPKKEKKKMRGRSKIQKKLKRKQKNVVDANTVKLKEDVEREKAERATTAGAKGGTSSITPAVDTPKDKAPLALKRFFQ
jgi:U3 small nucleolar RNA-associated protein 7